ncbi:NAD(+) synthase [Chloroflexota bacterium]
MDNTSELTDRLVSWIREQVSAGGCQGAVLGLSGGIDSSLAAALCQRALPRNTLGILMPCHSISQDEEHALAVAGRFSIPTRTVVLDGVYDSLLGLLPGDTDNEAASRLARMNLKARLRMVTLFYFANQLSYMVVGSSNRSELAVGYFTKYGDGGVDIIPLGNLVKGQVRELARFLDIPGEIIDKPPSAGLWEGQTDEGELGFSYEELDGYLLTDEASASLKEKINSMTANCGHKRLPPPIPDF